MSARMKEVEQLHGKPIAAVLVELYDKHGNVYDVAHALGVSQGTVSLWIQRAGLEFRTMLIDPAQMEVAS